MTQHKHGDIYWVELDPTIGSEMKKIRPCLIIFHNVGNRHSDRTIIVPFTSTIRKANHFIHVKPSKENKLKKECCIVTSQIRSISVQRLKSFIGILEEEYLNQVKQALSVQLNINTLSCEK